MLAPATTLLMSTHTAGSASSAVVCGVRSVGWRPSRSSRSCVTQAVALASAAQGIAWKLVRDGNGYALEAHNASPYYITFSKLSVKAGQSSFESETGMVAPRSVLRLPIKTLDHPLSADSAIDYTVINDFGAATPYKGKVAP